MEDRLDQLAEQVVALRRRVLTLEDHVTDQLDAIRDDLRALRREGVQQTVDTKAAVDAGRASTARTIYLASIPVIVAIIGIVPILLTK